MGYRAAMALIYLIAGEQSGDVLGCRLMRAIVRARPETTFAGIGGTEMAAQGLNSLFPISDLALMGLLEILPKIRQLKARLGQTVADIKAQRPDIVVTIDSPGFTLRVLRAIQPLGIPRAHYVAPQVWAWREGRVKHFPGLWESLLCLLPFEPAFFARHGLPGLFVGHPVLESGADQGDAARFRARHGLSAGARLLIVMPGSRRTEVSRLLPILRATLERLNEPVIPVVPLAGPVAETVAAATASWKPRPILVVGTEEKYDAFAAAEAALTKSGTSTLELALAGVPMVVTYRANPVTIWIARRLATVKFASLLNILSDREIVPELLQNDATPDKLAAALRLILTKDGAAAQRAAYSAPLGLLRPLAGTPSASAAAAVLALLDRRQQAAIDHTGA